ncbi:uncharacterized protein C2orf81 homolog isoform X3 [Astatotilapia calliptera]|uniref:uncharacterized protein C2orf81 homolog isoform X3 n=1 Tax=Maylandia zebra TaxID=106582 RepID=UPI0003299B85|nr:uncharacterized protein C2orf81 homolog isoform X3 [Maylandia zebra]XP_026044398.1 uncharacterized protein C2orf81 homolog isoform X3 [Astatotilapia calliptera]
MPRSATKVQTDKHRRRSSVQVISPAAQEQKGEDIIPGHSTRTQWTNMLLQEDADEAVGEILDELLRKVMKGCLDVYTESQRYLTQIVEHQILCLDEGEGPVERSKTEDSEPVPPTSDAWAQGCVPVLIHQQHLAAQEVAGGPSPRVTPLLQPKICDS